MSKLLLLLSGIITIIIFTIAIQLDNHYVFSKDKDQNNDKYKDKDVIVICCTWGPELSDRILTYSIKDDSSEGNKDAVRKAAEAWNSVLNGIKFVESHNNNEIEISFKNDGKKIAGKTVNYFDYNGLIRKSEVIISEESYNRDFSENQIEQIAKHELGHVLGLGHANFNGNLMTDKVNKGNGKISSCEIKAVEIANSWIFNGQSDSIYPPSKKYITC